MHLPFLNRSNIKSPLRSLLSTSGLVACYLPYRDVIGRNVMPSGAEVMTTGVSGWVTSRATLTSGSFLETTDTGGHFALTSWYPSVGSQYVLAVEAKPNGRNVLALQPRAASDSVRGDVHFNLVTGVATVISTGAGRITSYGSELTSDGYRRCWIAWTSATGDDIATIGGIATAKDDNSISYSGDITKGLLLRNPQINLGSTLYPYSAPVGLSQTLLDYSGKGNHATLGSNPTAVDTADPTWRAKSLYLGADDLINYTPSTYNLLAWGSTATTYGWVDAIPATTAGYFFGALLVNRTPSEGEQTMLKANLATILAGQGVTPA